MGGVAALAKRLRGPMVGQIRGRSLNWGSPVSPTGLFLYYPCADGHVLGIRNVVPSNYTGFTDPQDFNGDSFLAGPSIAAPNFVDIEDTQSVIVVNLDVSAKYITQGPSPVSTYSPAEWTTFIWCKPTTVPTGGNAMVLQCHGGFADQNVLVALQGSSGKFEVDCTVGGAFKIAASTTSHAAGHVFCVAGTCDSTSIKCYINGVLETTTATGGPPDSTNNQWRLGDHGIGLPFDGKIWNAGFFSRVLSAFEISYLYNNPWTLLDGVGNFDNVPRGGFGGEWRL